MVEEKQSLKIMEAFLEEIIQRLPIVAKLDNCLNKISVRQDLIENKLNMVSLNMDEKSQLMTINEILKEYKISRTLLYQIRLKEKVLPKCRKGKIVLFDRKEIEKALYKV